MRVFRKILLGLLSFLFFTSVLIFTLVLRIWLKPSTVINEPNLRRALTYAPSELSTSWTDLEISFKSLGFWGKTVRLEAKDLCVAWKPLVSSCTSQAQVQFSFVLDGFKPQLTELGELIVQNDFVHLELAAAEETTHEPFTLPDLRLPALSEILPPQLPLEKLGVIDVKIQEFKLQRPESEPLLARAALQSTDLRAEKRNLRLQAEIQINGTEVRAESDFELQGKERLVSQGNLQASLKNLQLKLPWNLTWDRELAVKSTPDVVFKNEKINLPLDLRWNQQRVEIKIGAYETRKLWAQGRLGAKDCVLNSKLHQDQGYPEITTLQCTVLAWPKARIRGLKVIETLLQADVRVGSFKNDRLTLQAQAELSGENAFIVGKARTRGDVILDMKKMGLADSPTGRVDVSLRVPDFQVWRDVFEKSLFAIPAPLHVLRGEVALTAAADMPERGGAVAGTAELKTNLSQGRQRLITTTQAEFKLLGEALKPRGIDVSVEAELTDVRIEAPPLRLESPPQILPDGRFVLTDEPKKTREKKNPFEVIWRVKVKTGSALQIISNLFPAPVPIALDITTGSDSKMEGVITVQSFPLEFFRKKAQVEQVRLTYHRNSTAPELNGQINYATAEVETRMLLLGTTAQPRIEFESDPPLNRQQIISVMLFNKSLDELTEEEVNSTASMSRALSDQAFGLFSLFFLSATPIQSIAYDPVAQAYTARVALDSSTTLSVGSDFSTGRQFTVRRRLGGPWFVRTELRQEENRPDVVLTLLEWLRRF